MPLGRALAVEQAGALEQGYAAKRWPRRARQRHRARVDRACLAHLAPALPALGHPAAPLLDAREAGGSRGGEERGHGLVVRDLLDAVVTENALIRTKGG